METANLSPPPEHSPWGIHELQPVPDAWLKALNPQVMVHAGAYTNEPEVNIQKHRTRLAHLVELLPGAVIAARWWYDDDILLRLATIYFAGRLRPEYWWRDDTITHAIAQRYADRFFPLHVPGTVLMVGNEDAHDKHDPLVFERTVALHVAVCKLATENHIECALGCTPMGTPEYGQYELLVPLFHAMEVGRAAGVVHWWRFNTYFPVPLDESAVEHLTVRSEREGRKVAAAAGVVFPPCFIGEIGTVKSLDETGVGQIGAGVPVDAFASALKAAGNQVPVVIYCWGDGIAGGGWESFNIARDPAYVAKLPGLAPRTSLTAYEQWKGERVTQKPTVISAQAHFCPRGGRRFHMSSGEDMESWYDGNIGIFQKNGQREEMWLERVNGVVKLMRGLDTSCQPPPPICDGTVYALYRDAQLTQYGGEWCDEALVIGKVYKRTVWVQVLDAATGKRLDDSPYTGWDTTYFKCIDYHLTWSTPELNGLTLANVAECIYSHDPQFKNVAERYFYPKGYGLGRFVQPNPPKPVDHFITRETPAPRSALAALPWWVRPPVAAIEKGESVPQNFPAPTSGGKRAALAAIPKDVINIRPQPNPNSATTASSNVDLGDLLVGDEVMLYDRDEDRVGDWVYVEILNQVTRKPGQQAAANGWVSRQGGAVQFVPALLPEAPMVEVPQSLINSLHQKFAEIEALRKELPPASGGGF